METHVFAFTDAVRCANRKDPKTRLARTFPHVAADLIICNILSDLGTKSQSKGSVCLRWKRRKVKNSVPAGQDAANLRKACKIESLFIGGLISVLHRHSILCSDFECPKHEDCGCPSGLEAKVPTRTDPTAEPENKFPWTKNRAVQCQRPVALISF